MQLARGVDREWSGMCGQLYRQGERGATGGGRATVRVVWSRSVRRWGVGGGGGGMEGWGGGGGGGGGGAWKWLMKWWKGRNRKGKMRAEGVRWGKARNRKRGLGTRWGKWGWRVRAGRRFLFIRSGIRRD